VGLSILSGKKGAGAVRQSNPPPSGSAVSVAGICPPASLASCGAGWFALKTPRGELVVRRVNDVGWIAELNGRALCYGRRADNLANLKVVFDTYIDAQTLSLLWLFASGRENTLHWYDRLG
jgi:hypothetical protein